MWLLDSSVNRLGEVLWGIVCCFVGVCFYLSAAWVGNVDVDLPNVGDML